MILDFLPGIRTGFTLFLFGLLSSCLSLGTWDSWEEPAPAPPSSQDFRSRVIQQALGLLGKAPEARVTVRGQSFTLDCIGTISAAFWGAGVDVRRDFGKFTGNGVSRLYKSLESRGGLRQLPNPRPGDIILWDNTWDSNGDGVFGNDGHTHAGIVVEVKPDKTVVYLHEDYSRGIVLASMNLEYPDQYRDAQGNILNTPLYMGSSPGKPKNPPRYLSGDLWAGFGHPEVYLSPTEG